MNGIRGLWSVLAGIPDAREREDLALVAVALQVHFADRRLVRERAIVEFMAIRFGWESSRTRRHLDALVQLGVLRCARDLADNWAKAFEVLDRPHVPADVAVEMAG